MTTHPDDLLRQALAYAVRGWPVFPCHPGTKHPATRHGFRDAATDRQLIEHWWHHQPHANLAIATGAPGPDVLDIDHHGPAGHGFTAYHRLAQAGLLGTPGAIVATPGRGLHLYFTGTIQPSRRLPRLAPPSQIAGRPYRLLHASRTIPGTLDWQAITTLLEPPRTRPAPRPAATADRGKLTAWVARLQPGNRNSGLFWAACRAIESGQLGLLDDLAEAAASAGLPDREISTTIASARRTTGPRVPAGPAAGRLCSGKLPPTRPEEVT
jgi:hypothetical protein